MNSNIEIVGVTTCGTYPSWVEYTVGSFYNHVDKIVVINSGYDVNNPEKGAYVRLEREHLALKEIDIHNKIIEITPSIEDINELFSSLCNFDKDEFGRTTNITLSTKIAESLDMSSDKIKYILKLDSDQILYQITRNELENVIRDNPTKTGFRFAQLADYYHDFEHIGALPDMITNDGSLFYKSMENQRYCGQGSPVTNVDQHEILTIKTSHMRRITPPNANIYEHFYKRQWYHTFGPNSINEHGYNRENNKKLTLEQIQKIAHYDAIYIMKDSGTLIKKLPFDERIPYKPPLICKMTPLEYIKKGY